MQDQLTALILTYNESENIGRTLAPLGWISRILIVDSFSTDDTLTQARLLPNVEIAQRRFDNHTSQWNFGLDRIQTSWVLTVDADYELSRELASEIAELVPLEEISGYSARFLFRIFGHPLRASVYPPRVVLFRRDRARYVQQGHTQWLNFTGELVSLKNVVIHDDRKPLSRWLSSQDNYMKIEAAHLLGTPNRELAIQDRLRKKVFFAPPIMFLYLLFVRGLILDGWPGWYYVMQRTIAELLLSLRLLTEKYRLENSL